MIKKLLLLSTICASLLAQITLQEINEKPSGRTKNFLIWQYFKQDISPTQANKAYSQILGEHHKLNRAYLKKSTNKKLEYKLSCRKKSDLLKIDDSKCFSYALNSYKTLRMTDKQRVVISKRIKVKWRLELLKIQSEEHTQKAYSKYDSDTIIRMFLTTGANYRRENLNISLDKAFMQRISESKKVFSFLKIIIRDDKLNNLQDSILYLDADKISARSNFILALHSLKNNKNKLALLHLNAAYSKEKKRSYKDKYLFWMYKITKNKKYLGDLQLSTSINIYTLHAHELLESDVVNYFTSIEVKNKLNPRSIENPFVWDEIHKEISNTPKSELFELSRSYQQKNMIPVQSFLLEKAYGYNMHGYIMPYDEYLQDISIDEKALVYSIMRQESLFVPAALSRSFALGLMQLMPFLVDDIAKKAKEKIEYKDMFIPEKNIQYSLRHLKWMRKSLTHPLFMAYAYNGGLGFLKKHLKTGAFSEGKYEPYLSMELMTNSQSREYGKRVVANYVMYKKILGEEISLIDLLDSVVVKKRSPHQKG